MRRWLRAPVNGVPTQALEDMLFRFFISEDAMSEDLQLIPPLLSCIHELAFIGHATSLPRVMTLDAQVCMPLLTFIFASAYSSLPLRRIHPIPPHTCHACASFWLRPRPRWFATCPPSTCCRGCSCTLPSPLRARC